MRLKLYYIFIVLLFSRSISQNHFRLNLQLPQTLLFSSHLYPLTILHFPTCFSVFSFTHTFNIHSLYYLCIFPPKDTSLSFILSIAKTVILNFINMCLLYVTINVIKISKNYFQRNNNNKKKINKIKRYILKYKI